MPILQHLASKVHIKLKNQNVALASYLSGHLSNGTHQGKKLLSKQVSEVLSEHIIEKLGTELKNNIVCPSAPVVKTRELTAYLCW
uniref:Uncharacterized protein n=1 Tax=Arundo donax TaxID=35708 RepID=A0A0A9FAY0_ARUDO